jgi:hypothetical protein
VAASSALLLLTFNVQAEIITDSATGLQAWVPDNWLQSTHEGVLTARDVSGEAGVTFVGLPAESIEAGTAAIDRVLAEYVDNATTDAEPQSISLEDLHGVLATGTGIVGNQAVHWAVGGFGYNDQMLYVIAVADEATFMHHQTELSLIMLSIAPEAIVPPIQDH